MTVSSVVRRQENTACGIVLNGPAGRKNYARCRVVVPAQPHKPAFLWLIACSYDVMRVCVIMPWRHRCVNIAFCSHVRLQTHAIFQACHAF